MQSLSRCFTYHNNIQRQRAQNIRYKPGGQISFGNHAAACLKLENFPLRGVCIFFPLRGVCKSVECSAKVEENIQQEETVECCAPDDIEPI